jgi:hypothetical protein
MRKAKSWFTGYNSNVAGHEEGTVRYFVYNGGTPKFVGIINDVAAKGYQEIEFSVGSRANAQAAAIGASYPVERRGLDDHLGGMRGAPVALRQGE